MTVQKQRIKRPKTRNLVRWNDDMDIQTLLHLQKVCNEKNMKLPWDEVGARIGPTITGGAIVQHLAKVRARRVNVGLPVPEPLKRGGGLFTPTQGGITGVGSSGSRKSVSREEVATRGTVTDNEDGEDDLEVDKATDSDGSFNAKRPKYSKRGAESVARKLFWENSEDNDDYDNMKKPRTAAIAKGTNRGKRLATAYKRKAVQLEIPESPSAAAAEHAIKRVSRRININYADNDDLDDDTASNYELEDSLVASGSSLLMLTGLEDQEHNTGNFGSGRTSQALEDGSHQSRSASKSTADSEVSSKLTILQLGKSERAQQFLRGLGRSGFFTAPQSNRGGDMSFSPMNAKPASEFDMIGTAAAHQYQHQFQIYSDDLNFGVGEHMPFNAASSNYVNSAGTSYGAPMHGFLPPTPVTADPFGNFIAESFGNNFSVNIAHPLSAAYGVGASMPAFTAPQSPVTGGVFPSYPGYAIGSNSSNTNPSHRRFSTSELGNFGGSPHSSQKFIRPASFSAYDTSTVESRSIDPKRDTLPMLSAPDHENSLFDFEAGGDNGGFQATGDLVGDSFSNGGSDDHVMDHNELDSIFDEFAANKPYEDFW